MCYTLASTAAVQSPGRVPQILFYFMLHLNCALVMIQPTSHTVKMSLKFLSSIVQLKLTTLLLFGPITNYGNYDNYCTLETLNYLVVATQVSDSLEHHK